MNADNGSFTTGHSRTKSKTNLPISPRSINVNGATSSKFPRIEDCTHFHYDTVDYGCIELSLLEDNEDGLQINGSFVFEGFQPIFCVRVLCKDKSWVVRRNLLHFEKLDAQLHECVYDRKFSKLQQLKESQLHARPLEEIQDFLRLYVTQLSELTGSSESDSGGQIVCGPVLHWLETDNHGRNLVPHALGDVADINIPAIGAARVVKRYNARSEDELTLQVGDMVSIIEMSATGWWRGKQGLRVGAFPSQCVRKINSGTDVIATHERAFSPPIYGSPNGGPITKKHGKIMDFLRSFLASRPSKDQLKQKGILKERVFGCDLGELLHRTNEDIPSVVLDCTRFVEQHGLVDGIYRISGVASHIRFLRYEFDSDNRPDLERPVKGLPKAGLVPGMSKDKNMVCDPHSIAGLCKLFFRELPNPLLTYQLYDRFASAVTDYEAEERLLKVHDAIQQLPPPHYRTLKHLITHLHFMAGHDSQTSMHCRNLAIVWAPNLLRSREIEAGLAAFTEARVQSVVLEFLIVNGDLLFSDQLQTKQYDADPKPLRPRSLMMLSSTKLISLEEAQARSRTRTYTTPSSSDSFQSSLLVDGGGGTSVPMRRPATGPKTSNDRRKRLHKRAGTSAASLTQLGKLSGGPSGTRKNAGHPTPLSSSMAGDSPTGNGHKSAGHGSGPGWKTKLGSLLRKNSATGIQTEGSLRRCQSEDSLLSQSKQGQTASSTRRTLNFSNASLSSPKDAKGSERGNPEPQVPHISAANQHASKKLRPLGGIYEGRQLDSEDVTPAYNGTKQSSYNAKRGSSPFSELCTELPAIMGDVGLDFDPLSYQALSVAPDKRSSSKQAQGLRIDRSTSVGQSHRSNTNNLVSVRRVDSIQSLHGEPMFAAISSATSRPKSPVQYDFPAEERVNHNSRPTAHRSNHDSSARNQADVAARDVSCPMTRNSSSEFDNLTADNCTTASQVSGPPRLTRKKSAAELLGVAKRNHPVSTSNNNNNFVTKAKTPESLPVYSHGMSDQSLHPTGGGGGGGGGGGPVHVEYYSVPQSSSSGLERNAHYGSFVALVGKIQPNQNTANSPLTTDFQPSRPILSSSGPLRHDDGDTNYQNYRTKSNSGYDVDRHPERCRARFSPSGHAQIFSPRLDTFDPSGKRRDEYQAYVPSHRENRYTVPLSECDREIKSPHYRSHSVDSNSSYRDSPRSSGPARSTDLSRSFHQQHVDYHPVPAPRKHYRSFSAGDHVDERQPTIKPVPLPRSSSRKGGRTPDEPSLQGGVASCSFQTNAYTNLTYEYVDVHAVQPNYVRPAQLHSSSSGYYATASSGHTVEHEGAARCLASDGEGRRVRWQYTPDTYIRQQKMPVSTDLHSRQRSLYSDNYRRQPVTGLSWV